MSTTKIAYSSRTALAIGLASLASSSTFLAGRESTEVDNSSTLYDDVWVQGKVTVGTTPTVNTRINLYLWGSDTSLATTPLDVLDGTDSDETLTSAGVRNGFLALVASLDVDSTTSNRTYPVKGFSVAEQFGGIMPKFWGMFAAHNTGVALNSTGSNHELAYTGITYTNT